MAWCALVPWGTAQTPFENGISLAEVTGGLKGPSSIAIDTAGRVYVASIYDKYGSGNPTDIYRVLPDGTVELFTAPILDPDVLCLDAAGDVYVGAWPGKVTHIDPSSGAQTTWISDTQLGNIDGMAFDAAGDLLVTAIDHGKIHRIDGVTREITLFADLTSLGLQGFGSIVVDPFDQSVWVASPLDGDLVHVNADGSLASAAWATGFQHMGQLALDGASIFVSDNVAGVLYRVDRSSGAVDLFVNQIQDYAGGLLAAGNGVFFATRQSADMTDGRLYRICPMKTALGTTPSIGSSLVLNLESPADANRPVFLFLTVAPGIVQLPSGRSIPVDLSAFLLLQSTFDAMGQWQLSLPIPNNSDLVGVTVYSCYVTLQEGIFGISNSYGFTIQP
jgi:streptogramin lyase